MKNSEIFVVIVLALKLAGVASGTEPAADLEGQTNLDVIIEGLRANDAVAKQAIHALGASAVPELLAYSKDGNREVRYQVVRQLASSGDKRVITVLAESLGDPENIVRTAAMNGLLQIEAADVPSEHEGSVINSLHAYLLRWDENSYKAAVLLGLLGDKSSQGVLAATIQKAKQLRVADNGAGRFLAPNMCWAAIGALLELRAPLATNELDHLVTSQAVPDRVCACKAVESSRRSDVFGVLLPLLADQRDAINVGPAGSPYYIRVCDVAARTIDQDLKISANLPPIEKRYSNDFLKQLPSLIRESIGQ